MIQTSYDQLRDRMVREQIEAKGVRDPRVLRAFRIVPRHAFVPRKLLHRAYDDRPLDIGDGQTISQPYMVACMTETLQLAGGEKVLEVGTGSGYQAAILSEMGAHVYTIERIADLSYRARGALEERDIRYRIADGTQGWPEEAPFDRIIVTAGAPSLPISLVEQLAEGGRMAIPVGNEARQDLLLVRREGGFVKRSKVVPCVFVKLVGKEGW